MTDYFYCESYQAFLYAIKFFNEGKTICVITSSKDIIKICKLLEIPYLNHPNYSNFEIITKRKIIVSDIKFLVEKIKGNSLHFSHTQYSIFLFLLIDKVSKNGGTINFYNFEFVYEEINNLRTSKKYFQTLFYQKSINYLYKTDIIIKRNENNFVLGINNNYLTKRKIIFNNVVKSYFNDILNTSKNFTIKNLPLSDCLFLDQGYQEDSRVDKLVYDEIIELINRNKFYVKFHPSHNLEDIFPMCEKYPSFLPAELLFNNVKKCVISVDSIALVIATKYTNLKVISLIEIVRGSNFLFSDSKDDLIKKSKNKILFPKTISELTNLL